MNVMVVDGSSDQRELISDALRELTNFVVRGAAHDIGTMERMLDEHVPDLVVTDARLPDGDCLDVIRAVRKRRPGASVVVFGDPVDAAQCTRCLEAGADLCLPRDAGAHGLQRGVVDLVGRRRAGRRDHVDDRFTLLGRLAAGVAHDLNNYLAVVEMMLTMLRRRVAAGEVRDEVTEALRATDGATRLVMNLLDYARGGAPAPSSVDLGALVRRVLDVFGRVIPASVVVIVDIEPGLPPVHGVAIELEQLVLNLLLNAADAMPRGGELRLSVARDGVAVRLDVADRGHGIGDGVLGNGPLSPSTKTGRSGAGLGLGLARAVADRHAATMRFVPRAGGGTRVTVLVPAAPGA